MTGFENDVQTLSILLSGLGSALLIKGALPMWSFFLGGALLFVGTIVLEGISMSLCSKVSRFAPLVSADSMISWSQ